MGVLRAIDEDLERHIACDGGLRQWLEGRYVKRLVK